MKEETKFAAKVDRILRAIPNSHWYNIQQVAIRGTPDRLGVVNGYFVALELKTGPLARISKLQSYEIAKIRKAGGYGAILYPENLEFILDELEALND